MPATLMSCEAYHHHHHLLTTNYYEKSSPKALPIIKSVVRAAVARERRMAASLIRLHFHDCFVQGCDASVLLKDSESIISEQRARQNNNSARGFEVIDIIKYICRREGLPRCGSHTIGNARCTTFRRRIHDETNIHPGFAKLRQHRCPSSQLIGNSTLAPLDAATPYSFDNHYFKNLLQRKGLLHSDQVLFNGGLTDHIVKRYSENEAAFFEDFAAAMVKMGDIKLLTGSAGEIRKLCSVVN
ncbi:peroxidase 5-like [Canna indica]|uniref:Peroxidase 5-like n=1 Tax=Canna indica TaxID=4628 RepID=A0AAQ3KCQ3_9LILI|nr:peroxidase 5-like [Canna indica]